MRTSEPIYIPNVQRCCGYGNEQKKHSRPTPPPTHTHFDLIKSQTDNYWVSVSIGEERI